MEVGEVKVGEGSRGYIMEEEICFTKEFGFFVVILWVMGIY